MTDKNNNPDCIIDITEDNAEKALKDEEDLQNKYFNGGKVVYTRVNTQPKKKKANIVKRPFRKWELRFLIITIIVIFLVLLFGFIYLAANEEKKQN